MENAGPLEICQAPMCVCVCVCVIEREREREVGVRERTPHVCTHVLDHSHHITLSSQQYFPYPALSVGHKCQEAFLWLMQGIISSLATWT